MTILESIKFIIYGLLILIGECTYAQSHQNYDSVDRIIEKYMRKRKIPGFATCIVKDKEIIWFKSYGKADINKNTPMSIDGIMNIGSI